MLAEKNHLFQTSITVGEEGIKVRIPNFWKNQEMFFSYDDITGISLDTPSWYTVLSYSTIRFNARGTWVEAHGFTKSDANEIKRIIEKHRNNLRVKTNNTNLGNNIEFMDSKTRRQISGHKSADRFWEEENRKKLSRENDGFPLFKRIQRLLSTLMATKLLMIIVQSSDENNESKLIEINSQIMKQKEYLFDMSEFKDYEEARNNCMEIALKKAESSIREIFSGEMDFLSESYLSRLKYYEAIIAYKGKMNESIEIFDN